MTSNRTIWLAGLLTLLVGVAWLTGVFDSEPTTIRVPEVDVPADDLDSVTIRTDTYQATLELSGGVWRVSAPVESLADSVQVGRLIDNLGSLELSTVVTTNPDRHSNYGVDSASGRSITVGWGENTYSLTVAAQGPDFSSSYVRLEDGPSVYTGSRVSVPATLDLLRDKTMARAQALRVRSADVVTPDGTYRLAHDPSGWMIARDGGEPQAADSTRITSWLRRFAPLRLDGFRDDLTPDSLSITHSVRLTQDNGVVVELFLEERDPDVLAYSTGSSTVMRASAARLRTLIEDPETLIAGE